LRQLAIQVEGQMALGEEFSASRLVELSEELGLEVPGIKADSAEKQKNQKVGLIMSRIFKDSETVEIDAFAVDRIKRDEISARTGVKLPGQVLPLSSYYPH
jgi:hypothetical protein